MAKKQNDPILELLPARFLRYVFPALVFITGAAVLVIEVVAVRALSPYYGNTLFNFSSVLSVILAGLSVGYYYGGRLADKRPQSSVYFMLILMSGLSLMLLVFLARQTLPTLSENLSLTTGPLISTILFFLVPAVILGMLSPFAVKLQSVITKEGVGTVAGQIFFWSTFGSITGSLAAGFVLIPSFGVQLILNAASLVLIILGLVPLLLVGVFSRRNGIALVLLVLLFSVANSISNDPDYVVFATDGVYERIQVIEGSFNDRDIRLLRQDKSNSGAVHIDEADPTDIVFDYAKFYVTANAFTPELKNALVIGAGIYNVPRALVHTDNDVVVDVVEIEPKLEQIAKDYFGFEPGERIITHIDDGRRFLKNSDTYDYIFGDAYGSLHSIPSHLTTQEFFELTKQKLNDGGVYMMNVIGTLRNFEESITLSQYKTFASVYEHNYVFSTRGSDYEGVQNITFIGFNSDELPALDILESHEDEYAKSIPSRRVDMSAYDLNKQILLTDDYAPVDYLGKSLL